MSSDTTVDLYDTDLNTKYLIPSHPHSYLATLISKGYFRNSINSMLITFFMSFGLMLLPLWAARNLGSLKFYVFAMLLLSVSILVGYLLIKVGVLRMLLILAIGFILSSLSAAFPPLGAVLVLVGVILWLARILKLLNLLKWAALSFPFYALIIPNFSWASPSIDFNYLTIYLGLISLLAFRLAFKTQPWRAALKLSFLIGTVPYLIFYLLFKRNDEDDLNEDDLGLDDALVFSVDMGLHKYVLSGGKELFWIETAGVGKWMVSGS